jgi:endosialidase-like protein
MSHTPTPTLRVNPRVEATSISQPEASMRISDRRSILTLMLSLAIVLNLALLSSAQQSSAAVPTMMKYSGVLTDISGKPLGSIVGVTFLFYKDEQGGAPLWMETQNVTPDNNGHYTVVLGSTSSQGLPTDLFASGEARWLGVQAQGQAEQARVLLLSVPYALKAGDAQTIGGLPASAFVLAAPAGGSPVNAPAAAPPAATSASGLPAASSDVTTTGGTVNAIPMFTTTTNVQNSLLTQTGTTTINVVGKLNLPAAAIATAAKAYSSRPETMVASVFNSGTSTAVPQTFQLQAEPVSNDTASASGSLNLLYGSGTAAPAETGLKISNKGIISFATGQTYPGAGTIHGVTAGTDLTGGGTTGTVTLNVDTTKVVTSVTAGTALTGGGTGGALTLNVDTTKIPQLAANNTFTGNETVSGSMTAGTFTGNGAALTNVNATALGGVAPAKYARLDLGDVFTSYVATESSLTADYFATNSGNLYPGLTFGVGGAGITSTQTSGSDQDGLDFWTLSTERMTLNQSGYLGIGTSNPYTELHLAQSNSGGLGPTLTLMNVGGGAGSGASVDFDGYDTTIYSPTVRIQSLDDGASSSSLAFLTKVPGSAANGLVEQMRLSDYGSLIVDSSSLNALLFGSGSSAGNGLIFGGTSSGEGVASCRLSTGACTDGGGTNHQFGLDFYTGYGRRMTIDNSGNVFDWGNMYVSGCTYWSSNGNQQGSCLSDARLKTNIEPFPRVLDRLAQLEPVHFDWNASAPSEVRFQRGRQTGLIAQQVEKVFPDMVTVGKDGYRRVNYGLLPYLLLEGVKELKASNDGLRTEANDQRKQNQQARAEIAKLRRAAAATDARVAKLGRSSSAKDAQIVVLSREIEQLRKTQQQMAIVLARFASTQGEPANLQTAKTRPAVKSPAPRVAEIARAQF